MPNAVSDSDAKLATWLFAVCGLIFAMVILGGVTRLTQSGLSMVDWRPVTGILPPLGEAAWEDAFARYREYPEYRQKNLGMDLAGFKSIFWLEYLHRLLGRIIGLVFVLPFVFFWATGRVRPGLAPRLLLLLVLGGLQGLLGWYMVKSGLVDRPDVSQYRLAAHLGAAVAIYGYALWLALDLAARHRTETPAASPRLRAATAGAAGLVFLTLLAGGFVAGLDAGFAFNTFPAMGGRLVPEGLWRLEPAWVNLFENVVTVQFNHRLLATLTGLFVAGVWLGARRVSMSSAARLPFHFMLAAAGLQYALGVSTLLLHVPVPLAAAHQGGALVLFSTTLWALHGVSRPR